MFQALAPDIAIVICTSTVQNAQAFGIYIGATVTESNKYEVNMSVTSFTTSKS